MDRYDLVVIGAGAAGESAAYEARELDARVAIIERDLFGGGCPFWQCMPSKALLHAAAMHHGGGDYPWSKASAFRDYMINRVDRDYPDDTSHFRALRKSGAEPIRGEARFVSRDPLVDGGQRSRRRGARQLEAGAVVLSVGSHSRIPSLPGLDEAKPGRTAKARACGSCPMAWWCWAPGPSGVELARCTSRYGVPVTLVHPHDRLNDRDHPAAPPWSPRRCSRDGVELRFNARATGCARTPALAAGTWWS